MKYSELKKKLRESGCKKVNEGGRHEIWFSPKTGQQFAVGRHNSEEVKPGTLKAIKNSAGL
jgi:predicted RNA binding protein YcfA (HicA-like mRNA interferase family)